VPQLRAALLGLAMMFAFSAMLWVRWDFAVR
jgi:hypothetical protein